MTGFEIILLIENSAFSYKSPCRHQSHRNEIDFQLQQIFRKRVHFLYSKTDNNVSINIVPKFLTFP